jgi:hypothetical protein
MTDDARRNAEPGTGTSRRRWRVIGAAALVGVVVFSADVLRRSPGNDRDWAVGQERMPVVTLSGDSAHVRDLRDFRHHADGTVDVRWTDASYDLAGVQRVWFALSPFSSRFKGLAHPFLSFEFEDGRFLSVSVEARKQRGQSYSAPTGLFRRYETMVVLGTEEDLLGLRAVAWGDPMYLYPLRVSHEHAGALLRALLERANELAAAPEFYHTMWNNCTTNLIRPVNELAERKVGRVVGLLPGYSYEAAYERGWIDTALPLQAARAAHFANDRIRDAMGRPDFSLAIRTLQENEAAR